MNFNDITFFKTAQGSKYIRLPDGRLRRWKSSHANTGGEDMGLHGWSTQSIFVDPKFEHPANSIQYLVGKGYKVALSKDAEGKMFPMIVDNGQWRPATWGDAYMVYARRNPDIANKVLSWKYSKEPVVGYHVVDFDLKGGGRGTEIKGYHFGSPVSEIGSLSDEDKKLFFPSQSNLQESIRRILKESINIENPSDDEYNDIFVDGEKIGYVILSPARKEYYWVDVNLPNPLAIVDIKIFPQFRGKKYMTETMNWLYGFAKENGYKSLFLRVDDDSEISEDILFTIYQRYGFRPYKTEDDDIFMYKLLSE